MYIKVGRYTYACYKPVSVGDQVVLPPPDWSSETSISTVDEVDVGHPVGYDGPIKSVLAVIPKTKTVADTKPQIKSKTTAPVTVRNFEYAPGGKWECGVLNFDAYTSIGIISWRETIPGPRHSPDSAEVIVRLNGKKIDTNEIEPPDLEPPNKEGKRAAAFRKEGQTEIAAALKSWVETHKDHDAIQCILVPDDSDDEENDEA